MDKISLPPIEKDKTIVLEPSPVNEIDINDENKFDERFKNRKSRRQFMKMLNQSRISRKMKIVTKKINGRRFRKKSEIVGHVKDENGNVSPKISWDLMPKFNKEMSKQYSEGCGFIKGWRNKNLLQIKPKSELKAAS